MRKTEEAPAQQARAQRNHGPSSPASHSDQSLQGHRMQDPTQPAPLWPGCLQPGPGPALGISLLPSPPAAPRPASHEAAQ